jgi:hypothetical protein
VGAWSPLDYGDGWMRRKRRTKDIDHAGNSTAPQTTDKSEGVRAEKPSAPVVIDGRVEAAMATLDVGFVTDATDVTIDVWGVDGLTVTNTGITMGGQAVAPQSRFARGDHVDVNVAFTAPSTVRTNLAIRVRGNFGGSVRERVQSFTVNADAPPATKAPGDVRTGPDGSPVRVMKAN